MLSRDLPVMIVAALLTLVVLVAIGFGVVQTTDAGSTTPPSGPPPTDTPSPSPTLTASPSGTATPTPDGPFTTASADVEAGETEIDVVSAEGFAMGDEIMFDPGGENEEMLVVDEAVHMQQERAPAGTVTGDYLVVTTPLQFDHAAGETIINLGPASTPTGTATATATATPTGTATATPTVSFPACPGATAPPGGTCPPCPGFERAGAESTCPPTAPPGQQVVWADDNCSGGVDPVDSLLTLRFDAGLSANTGECPDMGATVDVLNASLHIWGDADCSGEANPIDSLKILRFDAGLSVSQEPDCPEMGSQVTIAEA